MKLKTFLSLFLIGTGFFASAQNNENLIDPSKIEIVRDSFGVPHIFAPTDAEVAYGLAWATAEDDVENSQFIFLALRSMLGRHLGKEGAKIDFAVQFLGVNEYVEEHYEAEIPEDFKRVLEGYCQGINAYMKQHPELVHIKQAFPVKPQDLVAGYMLAMALMGGVEGTVKSMVDGSIARELPDDLKEGIGSNAFAFNSPATEHGNSFLAVNAHQPIEGLLSWYEAHVCSEEGWNMVGGLFHGACTIFLGCNENLGWAHTTGQLDEKDVYKLTMHPKKKNYYKFDDKWLKLEKRKAKFKVALGKKKKFKIPFGKKYWKSIYGPTIKNDDGYYALRMPALMDIKPSLQWFRMNKAKNFTEFRKALEIQGLSRQNITYADKNDTIFFVSNGLIPKRSDGYDWLKVLPGDTSATLWTEYLPLDSLANFLNPECGFVFNTNNAGFEATCPTENGLLPQYNDHIGYREQFNNRSMRFYEMMDNKYYNKKITFEDFKDIKFDHTYPQHMTFKGRIWFDDMFKMKEEDYPEIADALKLIKAFDHSADTNDINYPIFMYTVYMILKGDRKLRSEAETDQAKRFELFAVSIKKAKEHMLEHFGRLDIPTSKVQILERGGRVMGLDGGPDAIRAVFGRMLPDGRIRMLAGDGYIQLTKFTKDGPEIWSISPFGASSFPDSPHYNDQMQMFSEHKLKRMSLDKEKVYKSAEKIYHPQ